MQRAYVSYSTFVMRPENVLLLPNLEYTLVLTGGVSVNEIESPIRRSDIKLELSDC